MKKGTVGEARVHVSASAEALYDMVTDVTRMGEWSPETVRCEWLDGATGPAQGARFKGTNKRGVFRWSTKPQVVVAQRGSEFSFVTHSIGPSTKWTYRFEAADGGTDLVESFETLDDDSAFLTFVERYLMRIDDRKADLEAGMRRTLERIRRSPKPRADPSAVETTRTRGRVTMPVTINDKLISWASDIDAGTIRQAEKTARLPIVEGHVALMPDAHVGIGATVGSVIPTKNAVIPSAVGVDIGCGMIAAELDVTEHQLPDSLEPLLTRIERAVPAGVGKGHDVVARNADRWLSANRPATELGVERAVKAAKQFGTLGSGNHFVELCVDERGRVWVVLHSGSRGIGNQLAQMHIAKARTLAKDLQLRLEDPDLAYFMDGTPEFSAYIADMLWAQDYALANRSQMMDNAMREVFAFFGFGRETQRINCHHNFTQREVHNGDELWITRKGAIKAAAGDLGVIPGSMGTRSYIVRGKGNETSWTSCSHGAGRRHSRTQAKKLFTTADLAEQMAGKVWLDKRAAALLDEIPSAYKDIDQVMADQADLVEVVHTLHQVLNYKGT